MEKEIPEVSEVPSEADADKRKIVVKDISLEDAQNAQGMAPAEKVREALEESKKTLEFLKTQEEKATGEIAQEVQKVLNRTSEEMRETLALLQEVGEKYQRMIEDLPKMLDSFLLSADGEALLNIFPDIKEFLQSEAEKDGYLTAVLMTELEDNVQEIVDYAKQIEYTGSFKDFLYNPDTGELDGSHYSACVYREDRTDAAKSANYSTAGRRVKKLDYMIDKADSVIWNLLEDADGTGQLSFPIKVEPNGSKKEVNLMYSINFDALEEAEHGTVIKKLTEYDKRVYIAIGGLYDAGNTILSLSQIYKAMGYDGKPGKHDKEKINKALTKFHAVITLNNLQEIKAGYKYPRFVYDGALLPFERISEYGEINGQLIESAIRILREPPLLEFARGRGQFATIPLKMLQSPVSKTENNLAIEDYLIERIARAKKKTQPNKILFSTVYKHIGITDGTTAKEKNTAKAKKKRAKETMKNYLDYYITCKQLKSYTVDRTGVTLEF